MRSVEAFKHVAVLIREELRQVHFSLPIQGHEFGTFFWMAVSSNLIIVGFFCRQLVMVDLVTTTNLISIAGSYYPTPTFILRLNGDQ
jgi:hypothetical protein